MKYYGEWLFTAKRSSNNGGSAPTNNMNKKDEDGDRARMANSARKMNMKMCRSNLTSLFRRNG